MWTCSECGERLDPTFDTCWKCGTRRALDPPQGGGRWREWMFDRGPSAWGYILRMGVTSLVPSLAIGAVLLAVVSALGLSPDKIAPDFKGPPPALVFIAVVVISPLIETLFMSLGISILSLFTKKPLAIATLSALMWGCLHSSAVLYWGIVIAWPFFVFSCAYLAWRPLGWAKAVGVAACVHMFQNLLPGLALLFAP